MASEQDEHRIVDNAIAAGVDLLDAIPLAWSATNLRAWRAYQPSNGSALNDYAAKLFTLPSFFIELLTRRTRYGG